MEHLRARSDTWSFPIWIIKDAITSYGAAGIKLKQLVLMNEAVHPHPSLLGCPPFQKYPSCNSCPSQLKGRAARHGRPSTTKQGQDQTPKEGLLAAQGERKGEGSCCQLVCVHLGWHSQPCNCCIMNLAMEFKSNESFRPRKHESAPQESGDVKMTYI